MYNPVFLFVDSETRKKLGIKKSELLDGEIEKHPFRSIIYSSFQIGRYFFYNDNYRSLR